MKEELETDVLQEEMELSSPLPGLISLYGDIDTENESVEDLIRTLNAIRIGLDSPNAREEDRQPLNVLISSPGGDIQEMFAIYDSMRLLRSSIELKTIGMGKVMSAAVLLLAAGTPGSRYIGENCRVMIHGTRALMPQHEPVNSLQNELKELKWLESRYVECLARDSKFSVQKLKRILARDSNFYMSAQEAVNFGIADHIL